VALSKNQEAAIAVGFQAVAECAARGLGVVGGQAQGGGGFG
jgi:hypothetical protein